MGVVWRARDELLDRDVAVKEVQIAETLTAEERDNAYQRTLREAKTAARLSHPGVVSVFDVANDGGRPWIVMELVNARSLDQVLLSDGPLSPRQTAEIGRQLLSALSVAHGAGVLHRDVKPSNVLLGTDGRAVLTDFGIATFQGDPKLTQTGMVMGSPGFTAPERIRGGEATPASDLWSLGATLFAAVEGHGPYESRGGAITTMSAIINEDAPDAPAAGALARVIEALLRRDPAVRPDAVTASQMISDALPMLAEQRRPGVGYSPTALSVSPSQAPAAAPSQDAAAAAAPAPAPAPAPGPAPAPAPAPAAGAAGAAMGEAALVETSLDSQGRPAGGGEPATSQNQPWAGPAWSSGTAVQPSLDDVPASRFPTPPAPDFSSWYDNRPLSRTSAGYEQPPSPAATAWPQQEQSSWGTQQQTRRKSGLRWKLALAALLVIGAGAGAATVMALQHHTAAATGGAGSASHGPTGTSTGTTANPASINQSINEPEPATGTLPSGFQAFSLPAGTAGTTAGFQIAHPSNWSVERTSGVRTRFQDPDLNAYLLVDMTRHTYPDMLAEARYIERQSLAKGSFPGYQRIEMARINIRGRPGAYWKFQWNDNGTVQEVLDLMYIADTSAGQQSYALYFTAPKAQWNALHVNFDPEAQTFAPLPS